MDLDNLIGSFRHVGLVQIYIDLTNQAFFVIWVGERSRAFRPDKDH